MNAITRNNYEEFFILYMDNELGNADRDMVERFVELHPDLKEELELLLQTRFTPEETIHYAGKEELMMPAGSALINLSNYDSWMVLYIDNELNSAELDAFNVFMASNPGLQKELDQFAATRVVAESTVVFPDKESLYRREEKRRPVLWWRMAAAAALLVAITTTAIITLNKNNDPETPAIVAVPEETTPPSNTINTPETSVVKEDSPKSSENNSATNLSVQDAATPAIISAKDNKQLSVNATQVKNNETNIAVDPEKELVSIPHGHVRIDDPTMNSITDRSEVIASSASQQNDNISSVTLPINATYYQRSVANPEDANDISSSGSKKNRLRGFLRKVTRTFEKTTNIETTDDDDRLLVGGLAIKL